MSKIQKTNAIRILDKEKIEYTLHTYEWSEDKIGGSHVIEEMGIEFEDRIFKTIVLKGKSKELYVCVIHAIAHLDLKKVAKVCGEKSIELLPLSELEKNTGYIRGGCSPIGMKKMYTTFFDEDILNYEKIIVSAGKRGLQMEVSSEKILQITKGNIASITM